MPQVMETLVYTMDELTEEARERARNWYREGLDHDWYEPVLDDFCEICSILGVRLKATARALYGGGSRSHPNVWFRGFWSQGDGACYEGSYAYVSQAPRRIRAYAPQDAELHRIADDLFAVQRRNFYQLRASISHSGRYCHSFAMSIAVERDSPTLQDMTADAEDRTAAALRDLAEWLYRGLEREYEYQMSDAVVDEVIAVNGYTFTRNGRRCA